MSFPAVTVPAGISVEDAVAQYFVKHRYTAFPVIDGGRPVGLIDVEAVERLPASRRAATRVEEVATYDAQLVVDEHQDIAELLERPAFERAGRAIVLTERGAVGILSITDVNRALRAFELASAPADRGARARSG